MKKRFEREGYKIGKIIFAAGEYEMVWVVEGGPVHPPGQIKEISQTKFKLIIVEDFYFSHGNGD
jgi:hypothetical protein